MSITTNAEALQALASVIGPSSPAASDDALRVEVRTWCREQDDIKAAGLAGGEN